VETANLDKLQPNETLPVLIDNARELQLWKKETELIGIIEKQVWRCHNLRNRSYQKMENNIPFSKLISTPEDSIKLRS
jgi:hypothetical protein